MKKLTVILLCILLAVMIAGCGAAAVSQEAWRTQGKKVTFSLRDIGASTGYTWSYEISNPEVLKYVSDEGGSVSGMTGAASIRVFRFEGLAEGNTTLIFEQNGPDGGEGDRLRYELSVDAAGNVSVG